MGLVQFFCIAIVLSGLYFVTPVGPALLAVKPLAIWFMSYAAFAEKTSYGRYIGIGLILSSLGDVLLEMDDVLGMDLFIPGLLSFLTAHLLYIYALKEDLSARFPIIAVVVLTYVCMVLNTLIPVTAADLRVPVVVYALAIASMAFFAMNRLSSSKYTTASKWFGLLGALSFVSSDTALAFNKFHHPVPNAKLIIMLTYYAGQALIAASCLSAEVAVKKTK